jgi:hypothetical protein
MRLPPANASVSNLHGFAPLLRLDILVIQQALPKLQWKRQKDPSIILDTGVTVMLLRCAAAVEIVHP